MVTRLMNWFDDRLPLTATIERHLTKYPAPINMNIWYLAGVLLVVVLVIQLASGIWLLMNYEATADERLREARFIDATENSLGTVESSEFTDARL